MSDYNPSFVPKKQYALVGQKAVLSHNNKVLILQRSDKAGGGGTWSIPGGGLDTGDEPLQSIRREIKEETNLNPITVSPFSIKSYNNKEDFIVILGYSGKTISNKVKLNWEHTNYKWVDKKDALKEKLTDDARFFIEQFKK